MTMTTCFIFHFILISIASSVDFQCITNKSSKSKEDDDAKTYSYCSSGQTMTSCMIETVSSTWTGIDGSYISATTCVGQNGVDTYGGGVYSYAQCCTISSVSNCINVDGSNSESATNPSTAQCPNNHVLTGCSVHGWGNTLDGSWIGNNYPNTLSREMLLNTSNICSAHDSSPYDWGILATARCCASLNDTTLNCKYIISQNSGTSVGQEAHVSCPDGFAMTGCSGVSGNIHAASINAWYINNAVCYARNSKNGQYVIAMAICCEILTEAPTFDPTLEPTIDPTSKPTIHGIPDPTMHPSQPTNIPTNIFYSTEQDKERKTKNSLLKYMHKYMILVLVILVMILLIVFVICCGLFYLYRIKMRQFKTTQGQSGTLSIPLLNQTESINTVTKRNVPSGKLKVFGLQDSLVQMSCVDQNNKEHAYYVNDINDNDSQIYDDPGIKTLNNQTATPTKCSTVKYKLPSNNVTKAGYL